MSPRQHRVQPVSGRSAALSPWLHATPTDFARSIDESVNELAASTGSLSVHDPPAPFSGSMHPMAPGSAAFPAPGAELFEKESRGNLPLSNAYPGLGVHPTSGAPLPFNSRPTSLQDASALGIPPILGQTPSAPLPLDTSPGRSPLTDAGVAPETQRNFSRYRKDERRGTKAARAPLTPETPSEEQGFKGVRRTDLDLSTMRLEDLRGELSQLCKDQYGCRFLQKKLEEDVPAQCDLIFSETFPYFAELMTDPFGNYLCQKLLEYCTDAQRDQIVEAIAADLVTISLNMHGTRAVQKTIDFISTPAQTQAIIAALSRNVVTLIKDLNGNHVIQKCLNRLSAEESQFIYDAVAQKCMDVATHRHGCCVLQRCIDHATEAQRFQLVKEITRHALPLVQDPFGNYVVQYVLDLNDPHFSEAVTHQFLGNVCLLSAQKFSSNVIEKCIRVAQPGSRKLLVEELIDETRLESLLRDSFANYVVQTALDYAEPVQRMHLVNCIRPILPAIRNTPYGKRIQSKLQRDGPDAQAPYAPRGGRGGFSRGGGAARNFPGAVGAGRGGRGGRRKQEPVYAGGAYAEAAPLYAPNVPLYAPLRSMNLSEAPAEYASPEGFARIAPHGKTQW